MHICMCGWDGPLCGRKPEADAGCPHQLYFTSFWGEKVSYWSSNSWFLIVWLCRKLQRSAYLFFLVQRFYMWISILAFAWVLGTWSPRLNACTEPTELPLPDHIYLQTNKNQLIYNQSLNSLFVVKKFVWNNSSSF